MLVTNKEDRIFGMLCHLLAFAGYFFPFGNILGPLIMWLIKKDESAFVDQQGKESLNFQITVTIAVLACIPLMFVLVGIPAAVVVIIIDVVFVIIASVKAYEGEEYTYPFALRLIK